MALKRFLVNPTSALPVLVFIFYACLLLIPDSYDLLGFLIVAFSTPIFFGYQANILIASDIKFFL